MTIKYTSTVTLERWQVKDILASMGLEEHEAVFWHHMQKAAAFSELARKISAKKTAINRVRKTA